ncbi:polysaccharide deacetylase family protein [Sphingopyxis sp. RIFCSPHIGHO2_12_FULL_65_19]|uniref:polysaccharide deacetylase family protein n=1 Tax=Sphingopyxis sp. RIFCSPHIGHO2_12_FULL_65_19 TaxID=1802172 RepID=UPI0008D84DB4|nr:polysaccharide deacetylase family protein [Sphingopyxis sp. RIFCSPHIGHO2_12_FULL_65_19]OHD09081.1 MAG: WalW protein [Sphingopyxis sp. RIFCSPHIGHO2_12_FULL_65_19]
MVQPSGNFFAYPAAADLIEREAGARPRFWVTIDTEEDFDWEAPFARTGYRLASVPALADCQRYFERGGVKPIYLVDWPIVADDRAVGILGAAHDAGTCEIGAQLHPWVTPPYTEEVNARNSYTGNLPADLQRAKMMALRDAIRDRFGGAPTVYRAGRYGLGPDSATMLAELGFRCDTSVRSGFDYRAGHGPDYRDAPLYPWWVHTSEGAILEMPVTTVFGGAIGKAGRPLYHRLARRGTHVGAALARLGLVERIALTPEGIPADRACKAIDIAIEQGLPVLNFSFHSPSLQPGNTPYVRSAADLDLFYRWWDIILDHLARRGVDATTAAEILAMADRQSGAIPPR